MLLSDCNVCYSLYTYGFFIDKGNDLFTAYQLNCIPKVYVHRINTGMGEARIEMTHDPGTLSIT